MLTGRRYGGSPSRFCPSSSMRPDEGDSNPARRRSRVDLPQPEAPSSAKISRWRIDRVTWSTATKPSKSFETPSILRYSCRPSASARAGDTAVRGWAVFEPLVNEATRVPGLRQESSTHCPVRTRVQMREYVRSTARGLGLSPNSLSITSSGG
jgi:hypothetical protein